MTVILHVLGTFSVPLDVVGNAAFSALMKFDSYISQLSAKKRHLGVINFVNIDRTATESLVAMFTRHLRNGSQHVPPAHPTSPSHTKVTSDDDSFSESNSQKMSLPRNRCCVCGKTDSSRNKLVDRISCLHRCCLNCKSQPCNKCRSLPHAVAHSRENAEPQISPRDADSRAQNSAGVTPMGTAGPPSPAYRPRSNSFRVDSRRSPDKTKATDSAGAETDTSSSKPRSSDQTEDEFTHQPQRWRSSSVTRDDRERYSEKRNAEMCVICMDKMTNPKKLDCGHTFCADCIEAAFAHAAKCPCCGRIFGKLKGNQPTGGTMKVHRSRDDLAGYKGAGSFVIDYEIPSGFQQVSSDVYCLLVQAFDRIPRDKLYMDMLIAKEFVSP